MWRAAHNHGVLWQKGCFCVVFHGAGGGESTHTLLASAHRHTDRDTRLHVVFWHTFTQSTTGRTAGKYTEYSHTLHTTTAPPHDTHTHTRTDNGNGGAVVKSGNIKVDLRSGAALPQERTRTHARTRAGHFEHFPRVSVCAFSVCFSVPLLCRFLTLFCRGF